MKIAFLATRADKPSTRFRISQYFSLLSSMGLTPSLLVFPKNLWSRLLFYHALKSFDVVVISRKLLTLPELLLLKKYSPRLFFDFDDAIIYKDSNSREIKRSASAWRRFKKTIALSHTVLAGNAYLKDMALPFNPRTLILPTPVDTERYQLKNVSDKNPEQLTIGWMGSASTLFYLKQILPALETLYRKYPFLQLKIVANDFFTPDTLPVLKKKWAFEDEVQDLHSFDIGVMPLTDDVWARGKCGLKLLQYMACGISSVCSPVGVNAQIIEDGIDGFHASNTEEWISKLEHLILNPSLRAEFGMRARKKTEELYSVKVNGEKLARLFREACGL